MPHLIFFFFLKTALNGEYVNNGYPESSLPLVKAFTIMLKRAYLKQKKSTCHDKAINVNQERTTSRMFLFFQISKTDCTEANSFRYYL